MQRVVTTAVKTKKGDVCTAPCFDPMAVLMTTLEDKVQFDLLVAGVPTMTDTISGPMDAQYAQTSPLFGQVKFTLGTGEVWRWRVFRFFIMFSVILLLHWH